MNKKTINIKVISLVIIPVILIILTSCTPMGYFPNTITAPLLREKEKAPVVMGVIFFANSGDHHYYAHFSYALSDHVFLQSTSQLNHTTYLADVTPDTSYSGEGLSGALISLLFANWDFSLQTQLYTEAGIGYYLPFRENYIFEAQVGAGWGRNRLAEAGIWGWDQIDFYKLFVQVDIGVREKYFDFGFGYRESYLNQYNIELEDEAIGRTNILFYGDPFVFAAAGQENYGKVYIKFGLSTPNLYADVEEFVSIPYWWSLSLTKRF